MSVFVIIHITPAIPFELSVHIYIYPNNWDIFLIGKELINSRPGPFGVSSRRSYALRKEHINYFPQTGSCKIILKYAADNICPFLMDGNSLANQDIAIRDLHSSLTF